MSEPSKTSTESIIHGEPAASPVKRAGRLLSSISVGRLKSPSIILFLVACGLVPLEDFVSVLLASLYIYTMAKLVFPPVNAKTPPSVYAGSKSLKRYVTVAAYVGLFFPLAYIMLGLVLGEKKTVKAAAPHTFLLACQTVSEMFTSWSNGVSLPARLVPIL